MAQPPPDVGEDDCLPEYRHLFCPDLLRDKVAFITGGGSGIGFRIAEIFMRCSWKLPVPRQRVVFQCLQDCDGHRHLGHLQHVSRALREVFPGVCPCGRGLPSSDHPLMPCPLPRVLQDHGGVIVNITATLGARGQMLQVHAGSAKAAVDAMTRHLAVEWGPQNIRVNSLAPGPISGTEGLRRLGGSRASMRENVLASPLQRLGNKTEIAHSVLYLASPLASYVTGALLVVDGGAWLTFPNDVKLLADFASSAKL
ncbi:peroxisomal 2,4-dienoyl-CoA reductase [(3E)-enoyl-CoA-producing] isoform X3 [Equus caballus]|uniref:peroxisomal 2,4-dienoyl-CoA reductase [(3E)-enoyl-CoA-producing] isoform X3 n=1 Tax=Equus caballus TaxID=9796 RepID=UPI0038B28B4A